MYGFVRNAWRRSYYAKNNPNEILQTLLAFRLWVHIMKPKYRGELTLIEPGAQCGIDRGELYFPGWAKARRAGTIVEQYCWRCEKYHFFVNKRIFVRWTKWPCGNCGRRACPDNVRWLTCQVKTDTD